VMTRSSSPLFSPEDIATIENSSYLQNVYESTPLYAYLQGEAAVGVGVASGPVAPRSLVLPASSPAAALSGAWPKVCFVMGLTYAASTALWGVASTAEDTVTIGGNPAPTVLVALKISGQVVADVSGFYLFGISDPRSLSLAAHGWAAAISSCDLFELASNPLAWLYPAYTSQLDAFVTGMLGAVQLSCGGIYAALLDTSGPREALNLLSNFAAAFEWIPQLLKLLGPDVNWVVPVCDVAAYGSVVRLTVAGLIYGLVT